MDPTPLSQIAQWAGGNLISGDGSQSITNISTDSRTLQAGDVFLALRGERFDGNSFVRAAAEAGAAAVIVDEEAEAPEKTAVIRVVNTLQALQRIAAAYRRTLPLRVVAITGSNGKTSTKDFTAAILSRSLSVVKTEGNFNNHIGLPLTMLRATAAHQAGVFEIGMNHPGEVAPLAEMAAPEIGIITNVGVAHIEFMGTRDAIAHEKGMLAEAVAAEGCVILNPEDDYSAGIAERTRARKIYAGIGRGDVRATDLHHDADGTYFSLSTGTESAPARLNVTGTHMIQNAVLAAAAGLAFGVPLSQCAAALGGAKLTKGRLEARIVRGVRVLDDTYNANPDSMRAALRTLALTPVEGRRIAVLGRMGELGAEAAAGHARVGSDAASEKVDVLIAVGEEAAGIAEAAESGGVGTVRRAATNEEAAALLRELAEAGDLVLIKGSRSERMETIIEEFARS